MAFNQIINNYPHTTFSRNQIIFSEGEKCSKIGIIIEGEIKISTITHHEKEETFTIVKKGDIFGNSLIFSSSPYYLGDITATQKTTICFISKSDLIKELSLHPDLLESYINLISDKAIRTTGAYPVSAAGVPFDMKYVGVKGDILTDLNEDLAAEQKARTTYDNILRLSDDPDVNDVIKFLREREIVHYQRFGENLRILTDKLDSKNFYAFNPSFDKKCFDKAK